MAIERARTSPGLAASSPMMASSSASSPSPLPPPLRSPRAHKIGDDRRRKLRAGDNLNLARWI
ncbi:hypothetical protein E2562_002410 [Oryza meyeriana var. granulata]|uniref:Uncharacterized protein n=1 Tax=Oryza meyeriana var. granulata TaxID=110450 RepID=A0A6G1F2A1_9ORYZ|nr:hypothetical protein E2562_002410 [Oryza meyeriana var. granulata]